MIALSSSSRVIPAVDLPFVTTTSSTIICQVYDQYFSPIPSKTVNFTTDAGIVTPQQSITDTNGQCTIQYISDSQIKLVSITAETL